MLRSDIFIKVVVDHPNSERPERLAEEISRRIEKLYGVRRVEVSNCVTQEAPQED